LSGLIAAACAGVTFIADAADDKPYTAKPGIEKPGRAADEGNDAVKSRGDMNKPARAADDSVAPPAKKSKEKKKKKPDAQG
jgi:hypothetical protein